MKCPHPKTRLTLVAALLGVVACGDSITEPQMQADAPPLMGAVQAATKTTVNFTMGPLAQQAGGVLNFPVGNTGRFHFRNVPFSGPVIGDLEGAVEFLINGNLAAIPLGQPGSDGPGWGTLDITTADGLWSGNYTAQFIATKGFIEVNLHGPMQQKIHATCVETTATSEIFPCSGEVLSPHN